MGLSKILVTFLMATSAPVLPSFAELIRTVGSDVRSHDEQPDELKPSLKHTRRGRMRPDRVLG